MGTGQELYRDAASAMDWLAAFAERDKIAPKVLRRNFRNPREQYFFAEAFYEAWPDSFDKVEASRKRLFANRQQDLSFDRSSGGAPKYISVTVNPLEFDDFGAFQADIFADTMLPILQNEFDELKSDENHDPVGLLVLVPAHDGLHARSARIALKRLCSNLESVGFIDYTRDSSRRASPSQHEIRLCTFHSARGLEGERVVVFGMESLQTLAEATKSDPKNLAFIALSRGLFATTIVVRATPRNAVHTLCESILQCIRRQDPTQAPD